jgi:hypothetical protein
LQQQTRKKKNGSMMMPMMPRKSHFRSTGKCRYDNSQSWQRKPHPLVLQIVKLFL